MILFVAVNTGIADINLATPIRQGVHIEWYRTVCPGGNGSAIFVWSDTRLSLIHI